MIRLVVKDRYHILLGTALLVLSSATYAQGNQKAESSRAADAATAYAPLFQNSSVKAPPLPSGSEKVVLSPGVNPIEKDHSSKGHSGKLSNRKVPNKLPPQAISTTEE